MLFECFCAEVHAPVFPVVLLLGILLPELLLIVQSIHGRFEIVGRKMKWVGGGYDG